MGATEKGYETESKRVLARLLGGRAVDRDTGGAQGTRDFDLVTGSRVTDSVEVTSVQLEEARRTASGFKRLLERDLGLTQSWHLSVQETADLRPIERRAPALLNTLTALGIGGFNDVEPPADPVAAGCVAELAALRIPVGSVLPQARPHRLVCGGFGSGSLDPAELTIAVEAEASNAGNRSKLAAAPPGATRHLFLWLNDSRWEVSSLMRSPVSYSPYRPPYLPSEIDVVWVAVAEGAGGRCSALMRSDGRAWEVVDLDAKRGCLASLLLLGRTPRR